MAKQKVRYPRRGGVAQAEAYMWYVEHCAIPSQRGRSDFLRRHHTLGTISTGTLAMRETRLAAEPMTVLPMIFLADCPMTIISTL